VFLFLTRNPEEAASTVPCSVKMVTLIYLADTI
jgi:hypothetical protein